MLTNSLRAFFGLFLTTAVWLWLPGSVLAATSITTLSKNTDPVGIYKKFELTFQISRLFPTGSMLPFYFYDESDSPQKHPGRTSPYGKDGISIDAVFTAPSGKSQTVPAFYYQNFQRNGDSLTQTGEYAWKIRFAPAELGKYQYYLTVRDTNGSSRYPAQGNLEMTSSTSDSKGFIRVSPRDSRFLEFANGQSFIPNGSGRQWMKGGRTTSYEKAFADFKNSGINFTRIWDQNDGFGLTVEGHFDAYKYPDDFSLANKDEIARNLPKGTQMNQRGNYEEDIIIEAAEKNNVYIQLCSHGDPYWIWDASIYKEGWNPNPVSFADPQHLNYWKRNFRYRVARWGYSTSIAAWETWNEHGHITTGSPLWKFYEQYGQYQQITDPYQHLRTTSQGSQAWSPGFWSTGSVDLANYHDYMMISRYSADLAYDTANFVYRFAQCLRLNNTSQCGLGLGDGSQWSGPTKPIIWGELDAGTSTWDQANHQPKALHVMRWAGLFSPIGMAPLDWYWDTQPAEILANKYKDAKITADFFQNVDYAGKKFSYLSTSDVALTSEPISTNNQLLRVLALKDSKKQEIYAWVQNRQDARWDQPVNTNSINANFTVSGMSNGNYKTEYWGTYNHLVSSGPAIIVNKGNLTVPVTNLITDQAIKISLASGAEPGDKTGDANGDLMINGQDYVIWLNNYGQMTSEGARRGDFDISGKVDGVDYVIWLNNYGNN